MAVIDTFIFSSTGLADADDAETARFADVNGVRKVISGNFNQPVSVVKELAASFDILEAEDFSDGEHSASRTVYKGNDSLTYTVQVSETPRLDPETSEILRDEDGFPIIDVALVGVKVENATIWSLAKARDFLRVILIDGQL